MILAHRARRQNLPPGKAGSRQPVDEGAATAPERVGALAASARAGPEFFPIKPVNEKNETTIVVSDRQTEFSLDGKSWSPAVATWVHPSWAVLQGATWIWRVTKVSKDEAHNGSPVLTFRRKFTPPVGRTQAILNITADNAYQVSLNGSVIGSSGVLAAASNVDDGHWHAFDT